MIWVSGLPNLPSPRYALGMFGSHLSIAGGMTNALAEARELHLQTVQVFTRNQQQWAAPPLAPETTAAFRSQLADLGFDQVVAHDSYLINLATTDAELRQKSIAAFTHELERCEQLAIKYLVTHMGAHGGNGETVGISNIITALRQILFRASGNTVICLETTAGQGTCLGYKFEHLADVMAGVGENSRLAVCLDTCHVLAAGYDITTEAGTEKMLAEFDRVIGLKYLRVMHLNDSKKPLGSRVDRHTHIGHGHVGLSAFAAICRNPQFMQIPKILETPKEMAPNGLPWDRNNLDVLIALTNGETPVLVPLEADSRPAKKSAKPAGRLKAISAVGLNSRKRSKVLATAISPPGKKSTASTSIRKSPGAASTSKRKRASP